MPSFLPKAVFTAIQRITGQGTAEALSSMSKQVHQASDTMGKLVNDASNAMTQAFTNAMENVQHTLAGQKLNKFTDVMTKRDETVTAQKIAEQVQSASGGKGVTPGSSAGGGR